MQHYQYSNGPNEFLFLPGNGDHKSIHPRKTLVLLGATKPKGRIWSGLSRLGESIQLSLVTVLTPATITRLRGILLA
jgi:hypothetical protein